ncbi:MAG: DUF4430 domain-containing protein [Dehalococcoidia bacterium]
MLKRPLLSIIAIILILVCSGCATSSSTVPSYTGEPQRAEPATETKPGEAITLVITSGFGKNTIFEQTINIEKGTTAMEALTGAVQVETKYDGEFVSAINNTGPEYEKASGKKNDWFFYMNGIASNSGAGSYTLMNGDVEHWDYRNWGYHQFVPAVIGAFPLPFINGFQGNVRPTTVVYETEFQKYAEDLAMKLGNEGTTSISSIEYRAITDAAQKENNLIIIAGKDNVLITELNNSHKKLGFFTCFNGDSLVILDDAGKVAYEYEKGCGLIQATQNPWNPRGTGVCENVVWTISGTDSESILGAADILCNNPDKIRNACACIVINSEVIKIP